MYHFEKNLKLRILLLQIVVILIKYSYPWISSIWVVQICRKVSISDFQFNGNIQNALILYILLIFVFLLLSSSIFFYRLFMTLLQEQYVFRTLNYMSFIKTVWELRNLSLENLGSTSNAKPCAGFWGKCWFLNLFNINN
jgi:hypothetical protein